MTTESSAWTVGRRIFEAIAETDPEAAERMFFPDGSAKTRQWPCDDGYIVEYSTERARGGRWDGHFVVLLFKPIGKGSRSGNAEEWKRVYFRGFKTRATAKRRAVALYHQHGSPEVRETWAKATPEERREIARWA